MDFDVLILNGCIIDGSGGESFIGSIGIKHNKITKIFTSPPETAHAEITIKAEGLVVSPGFIDTHTHDDAGVFHEGGHMLPKISQGITSVIVGNCGLSLSPLTLSGSMDIVPPLNLIGPSKEMWKYPTTAEYVQALKDNPPSINVGFLTGHITLKLDAMQDSKEILERPANIKEIDLMKEKLREALLSGSLGLSTGLWYAPSKTSSTEEIISLASLLSEYQGIYVSHIRNEADKLEEAVSEALRIGSSAQVPVLISHHKAAGKLNWGKVKNTLQNQVYVDVYPYTAGSTILTAENIEMSEKVLITDCKKYPQYVGCEFTKIEEQLGLTTEECISELSPAGGSFFIMNEEDVQAVLKYEHSMIGSDGLFFDQHPHPRLYGTFPRVLGYYSRDTHLLSLTEAIKKSTSLPAQVFKLKGRGKIQEGYFADITIFDPKGINSKASYTEPKILSEGIIYVFVNGKIAFQNNKTTPQRAGVLLHHSNNLL
eukprot:TRINITY_DN563_c0_g1_i7.p1 TRINITY_DN563_c0_g1~~TRINITY_DN563_c0_g1_i7.p1  ORF type:complete len:484 (+),score=112.53 TRINITY_DN563_c0_g1_i7:37-1488(+)